MEALIFSDSYLYGWVVIPVLIFTARVIDVSMGTMRVVFISRGLKYLAPVVGFFEILVWLVAIGQIMKNLSNPVCYVAYAGGFAMGNFVGIWISERLSLGVVLVRVITNRDASELVEYLKSEDYGVTSIDGHGTMGQVKVVFTIVPRKEAGRVVELVKKFNSKAFYSIEEIGFVGKDLSRVNRRRAGIGVSKLFKPLRKGK
jgi:uncharacterized protein YebE (UPF0316 family)